MTLLDQETFDEFGYWPKDLSKGSGKKVCVRCDYCGDVVGKDYHHYMRGRGNDCKIDACYKCRHKKQVDLHIINYHIGEQHNKLTIICRSHDMVKRKKHVRKHPMVYCECACGDEIVARLADVLFGATTSCGCAMQVARPHQEVKVPYGTFVGDIFVSSPSHQNSKEYYSNCICPQCGDTFATKNSKIVGGTVKSCGNCGLMRNGNHTSQPALDIDKIIQQRYNTAHNYQPKNYKDIKLHHRSCIDIAIPDLKIAIEYDGYFNHRIRWGDKSEQDKKKRDLLKFAGWKVLTIYANGQIPTESQVFSAIDTLLNTKETEVSIVMEDWVVAEGKLEGAVSTNG